ncbi:MAG: hypothetical protein R2813_00795 [Flavobacteriales bacterium]
MVNIQYMGGGSQDTFGAKPKACVSYLNLTSELEQGVSQTDFLKARDGDFWDKANLIFNSPFAVFNRDALIKIYTLSRNQYEIYGMDDLAFYHVAEAMMCNISELDLHRIDERDFSEKGFINTFNHIIAQSFMTSIYSEEVADFIADVHERYNMPELVTGDFTYEQLSDLKNGPMDNYIDMINNEIGQEIGKDLKAKYNVGASYQWTPASLSDFLNEIQSHLSWSLGIGFTPFRATDELVIRFSNKLNKVMIQTVLPN